MARFRKKPVEVEATQFTGALHPHVGLDADGAYTIGRQGPVRVKVFDWIIAERDGSGHYPCAADVFAATYDAIEPVAARGR